MLKKGGGRGGLTEGGTQKVVLHAGVYYWTRKMFVRVDIIAVIAL